MKATSLFGGVQVFNILITLVRGKAVAVLIGTAGMGMNGLFLSGVNLIKYLTSLGIEQSAVRDMSIAFTEEDPKKLEESYTVFKRWIYLTAILGALVSFLFAPMFSNFAFGDTSYANEFRWLSIVFVFTAISGGIYTVLRATRKLKLLAQANILGAFLGLLVTLPILYFFGIDGVVPSIIVASIVTYLISLYFRKKIELNAIDLTFKETFERGKPMVVMGVNMSMSSLMGVGGAFALNAFITHKGSLSDLGLYSAGMSIMGGYVGMVFSAIGTDYFPRLSGAINQGDKWRDVVNQQAELVLIVLNLVLVLLVATVPVLIRVLLSIEFMETQNFIIISSLGVLLKGYVWVTGFVILSKGDNKLFFIMELVANGLLLILNMVLYSYWGLEGLGISMIITYIFSSIFMYLLMGKKYFLKLSMDTYKLLAIGLISLSIMVLTHFYIVGSFKFILLSFITLAFVAYQLFELDKRIQLKDLLRKYLRK